MSCEPAQITIRPALESDVPCLLVLMRKLATFERYLPQFAVTERDLRERGFPSKGSAEFYAVIAETAAKTTVGYAVFYLVPFTFDLRPTLLLKELFVCDEHRNLGTATLLLSEVARQARLRRCGLIRWTLLPDNDRAKAMYRKWGGKPDLEWEHWWKEAEPRGACARCGSRAF
jgi:GNAT superfamily N-acetyltransferase